MTKIVDNAHMDVYLFIMDQAVHSSVHVRVNHAMSMDTANNVNMHVGGMDAH